MTMPTYQPPFTLTPTILRSVGEISEWMGRHSVTSGAALPPQLRRSNRLRSIQASLAIENNSLTLEQVTAVIAGKRVLGLPREIQEVRNAFAAYAFEFIHPFPDGNGPLGRLWQTLILSRWKPVLAYLRVETVIRNRQADYYRTLAQADNHGDATSFIEFMLAALLAALQESATSDQVTDPVTDQVKRLLDVLRSGDAAAADLMQRLGLSHRPTFRQNYLEPALAAGLIERTQPDSPRSPTQRYRLSPRGRRLATAQDAGRQDSDQAH